MKSILTGLLLLFAHCCLAADLPRGTPEEQGVSSAGVSQFVRAASELDSLHSLMIVRHGHVITEGWWAPYNRESRHSLFSLSKSFTSTAVGLAIHEGKLSVDDEVLKFFPNDAPAQPSNQLKSMRVSDLLRMSTGQQTEPPRTDNEAWTKTFLDHPVPFKPGTHFLYNTSATYMQSAIVQKATGETVLDYLRPRLFEPLGIENPTWEVSPQGISTGGYGLSIRTEDIAKFGQLYLQRGQWKGKQLVPAAWVDAATARQTSNGSNPKSDWDQGYGYQFWRCRHGAYRGDGAFGQFCIVLPDQDAVIAITSGLRDMQSVLNLVWDKLLPAMRDKPLPSNEAATTELRTALQKLELRRPTGDGKPFAAAGRKYAFEANPHKLESLELKPGTGDEPTTLQVRIDGHEQSIRCGSGKWRNGTFAWGAQKDQDASACGAWTADGTYTACLCFHETPFVSTVTLEFTGNELKMTTRPNVGFGATAEVKLIGKSE